MSLKTLKNFVLLACFGGLATACGSSFVPGGGVTPDPSLSTATADVVRNVGAPNQMILNDHSGFVKGLAEDMAKLIEDSFGTDPGAGSKKLVRSAIRSLNDDTTHDLSETVTVDETEDCTGGGTVQFIGSFDLTASSTSSSGSLSGDYSIIYTNCEEAILLQVTDSPCSVNTELSGTLNNSLSINFYDLDPYSINRQEIRDSVESNGPVEFVLNSGSAQNLSYDFDFFSITQSTTDSYTGSLTFAGLDYSVTNVRDFIGTATASSVCP